MSAMAGQAHTSAAHRTDNHVKRVSWCSSRHPTTSVSVISALTLVLVLVVVLGPSLATAGDISCQGIRYTYFNKGLDTSDIPAAPRQGKNRIPSVTVTRPDLLSGPVKASTVILSSSD